jgi:hypothetical protein
MDDGAALSAGASARRRAFGVIFLHRFASGFKHNGVFRVSTRGDADTGR